MKVNLFDKLKTKLVYSVFLLLFISACQPDDPLENNGYTDSTLDPSFTITPINGSPNKFRLNAQKANILGSIWDLGDGKPEFVGNITQDIFLPDAGNYTITHKAIARGGKIASTTNSLLVTTSDIASGNLIQGGKFLNATDHAKWTILNIAGSHINWTFSLGKATVNGSSATQYAQQGIYQAIQVEANKKYKFDMKITGSACSTSWFEAYVGTVAPAQGSDYNSGGTRLKISTFDGCTVMNGAFSGQFSTLKCAGSGNEVQFPTSGTVYLVIRSGGFNNNNLGSNGISMTNVEFRGAN